MTTEQKDLLVKLLEDEKIKEAKNEYSFGHTIANWEVGVRYFLNEEEEYELDWTVMVNERAMTESGSEPFYCLHYLFPDWEARLQKLGVISFPCYLKGDILQYVFS